MSDCPENEALVAYVYDEGEVAERTRVERHLKTCAACAAELEGFAALRGMLREWAPPEARLGFRVVEDGDAEAAARPALSWWPGALRPAWGVALAATCVALAGAAIAGVEVRYDAGGFVFRLGWAEPGAGETRAVEGEVLSQPVAGGDAPPPWRAELAALEQQLRAELAAQRTAGGSPAGPLPAASGPVVSAGDDLLRQVRVLMAESERRQRREFASGLMRLAQEVDLDRQADQLRMQQEVDSLADYMVRVAQQ